MSDRALFDVVRELAHLVESHGIALYACSAEHVLKKRWGRVAYVRELRHLAGAIGAELGAFSSEPIDVATSDLDIEATIVALFAEALGLVGAELGRLAPTAASECDPEAEPAPTNAGTICNGCGQAKEAGGPCGFCRVADGGGP